MAETYGHLLPPVRTTCLRRPVVSATVCFVSVLKHTVIYFRWCAQHVCADRLIQLPFVSLQRHRPAGDEWGQANEYSGVQIDVGSQRWVMVGR